MPELAEQMYCSQQIVIPPKFPYILKRYCKAAIKTQPYDLLRWSFEYFKALSEHRAPPVKLRLEYPIFSTEGGLTRGCLKVLAQQLGTAPLLYLPVVKKAWQGFCLDPEELKRIFCLCQVYKRTDCVPFLHFIAVAGGLLTKCLTHTMILVCESLTKEPDGGSAAIPLNDFLKIYRFLATIDASCDIRYYNGYPEGDKPVEEESAEEETAPEEESEDHSPGSSDEEFWEDPSRTFKRISLIDTKITTGVTISNKAVQPIIGKLERSESIERAKKKERDNYLSDRKGRALPSEDVEVSLRNKLKHLSAMTMHRLEGDAEEQAPEPEEQPIVIRVFDEDNREIEYEIFGEPSVHSIHEEEDEPDAYKPPEEEEVVEEQEPEWKHVAKFVAEIRQAKQDCIEDYENTLDEIKAIVDRFNAANYDLGMVAGRQMSTTSGEFIAHHIEKEIMDYINEQIAILPDPDLKRKKARPEEVEMIRNLLEVFLDENMSTIVPELEEVEEEESPIPEVTWVYAVPGIGPIVDRDIVEDVVDYMLEVSKVQSELIMARNIRHYLCPPLEKFLEYKYPSYSRHDVTNVKVMLKSEPAPVGGTIVE